MRVAVVGLVTLVSAAVVGGAVWASDNPGARAAPAAKPDRLLRVLEVLSSRLTTAESAVAAATAACPGAAVEIELTTARHGDTTVAAWEIGVLAGETMHEVVVDAHDGSVISQTQENDSADEVREYAHILSKAGMSLGEILAAAKASVTGSIVEVDLDDDGPAGVWEIEVVAGGVRAEVELSRKSGLVVQDDDDDGDAADDDGEDDDDDHDGDDEDDDDGDDEDDDD